MSIVKRLKLLVRDVEPGEIALVMCRGRIVLILHQHYLEHLPAEGGEIGHGLGHVFAPVKCVENGVKFKLDTELTAPMCHAPQLRHVVRFATGLAPPNSLVD